MRQEGRFFRIFLTLSYARDKLNQMNKALIPVSLFTAILLSCGKPDGSSQGPSQQNTPPPSGAESKHIKEALEKVNEDPKMWSSLRTSVPAHLKKYPNDLNVKGIQGMIYLRDKNEAAAKKIIKEIQSVDPHQPYASILLSSMEATAKNWKGVLEIANSALKHHPNNAHLHTYAATAYAALGQKTDAEIHLKRVAAIDPTYSGVPVSGGLAKAWKWLTSPTNRQLVFSAGTAVVHGISWLVKNWK